MKKNWQLRIFNELPPEIELLNSFKVGDLDGDGRMECVAGGQRGLFWYRPATSETGMIASGVNFGVGLALADLDGDGRPEVVVGCLPPEATTCKIVWYKADDDLSQWTQHVIDPVCTGGAHDLVFVDLDGDGELELLANATGREGPGTFAYKRGGEVTAPWKKYDIVTGIFREGLASADLDGDGRVEIIHGPDLFIPPEEGPYAGEWTVTSYAPSFREMCRTALVDITGSGRPDVVIAESEFMEGRMSWFENRMVEDPENPWVEHELDYPVIYAHSLSAWREGEEVKVFMGEMEKGGWNAPYNFHARLVEYASADQGRTWEKELIYQGAGTHEAVAVHIDEEIEYAGKECCQREELGQPKIQLWKRVEEPSPLVGFRHQFIDRDKPNTGTDILVADVDGDGRVDVLCGSWWYRNPTWERREIPGIYQVHCAHDIDGDGREEIIATRAREEDSWYGKLGAELVWIRPVDPLNGKWEEYPIGQGAGDWPHGSCAGPLLPGGKPALVTAYHSAHASRDQNLKHYPDLWTIPDDPTSGPWERRPLAAILYGEQLVPYDITGDGNMDLFAGPWWLENVGDGTFQPHRIVADESFYPARLALVDVDGDGRMDVVMGQEGLDFEHRVTPFTPLAWFACPEDPRATPWPMHAIDTVRCAHSIGAGDLDGDGEMEIVAGEHDPFWPYRSQCRLYVYKKADPRGRSWYRYTIDDRFEHHDGTKVVELTPGKPAIISHGWQDSIYVHLWELEE